MEEAEDLTHQKQWELDQFHIQDELKVLRAKESLREELKSVHAQELKVRVRDDLIQMLKAKLAEVENQNVKSAQANIKKVSVVPTPTPDKDKEEVEVKLTSSEGESVKVTRKVTLPRFSREKLEDGAFEQSWKSGPNGKGYCSWSCISHTELSSSTRCCPLKTRQTLLRRQKQAATSQE